jgi:xylulokinase
MGLTCFRNGSLARERVRDDFGLSWDGFSRALRESPPGNNGGVMLPWFEPEITPPVLNPGVRRAGIDVTDPRANVRGLIEGQMMAMANHSRWMGVGVDTIFATGGASANRDILQVMADVFDAPVHQLVVGNSACLGAALRAWHGDALAAGRPVDWSDIVDAFVTPRPDGPIRPVPAHVRIYGALKRRYAALEGTGVFSTDSDK